jgi:hypothetical protein
MKSLWCLCIAFLLGWPAAAQADLIAWSYDWTTATPSVFADGGSTGRLDIFPTAGSTVSTTDIIASIIETFSTASPDSLDTFTNTPYSLSVTLTDTASGASALFTFTGTLNGTFSSSPITNITSVFDSPNPQSALLGTNTYTVTLTDFVTPGRTVMGFILAHVEVVPEANVPEANVPVPEPSALVLAGLGLVVLGGKTWPSWRRHSSGRGNQPSSS